ncbi:MAG: hypothetical protein KatS3mg027_0296 [Bacteroidia bacterium]|nr:MAG: hypothetical protein KatS3mg027_0296 [Bacteroidia bacterium]
MKATFIICFFILCGMTSCKRCYDCECYKQGQKYNEGLCEKVFLGGSSSANASQTIEKSIEVNKGYDNCECKPR